jgi:hypothetical protein
MISSEVEMTSSAVAASVVDSAEASAACQEVSSVEAVLEISVISVGVDSHNSSPAFHRWAALALLRPKLKPL